MQELDWLQWSPATCLPDIALQSQVNLPRNKRVASYWWSPAQEFADIGPSVITWSPSISNGLVACVSGFGGVELLAGLAWHNFRSSGFRDGSLRGTFQRAVCFQNAGSISDVLSVTAKATKPLGTPASARGRTLVPRSSSLGQTEILLQTSESLVRSNLNLDIEVDSAVLGLHRASNRTSSEARTGEMWTGPQLLGI